MATAGSLRPSILRRILRQPALRLNSTALRYATAPAKPINEAKESPTNPSAKRAHDTVGGWREKQQSRPLNQALSGSTPAESAGSPSVGAHNPPPELLSSADPDWTPDGQKSVAEAEASGSPRGQDSAAEHQHNEGARGDLDVGVIEGGSFRVSPLRRSGEDGTTIRARLLCTSLCFCIYQTMEASCLVNLCLTAVS